MAKTKKPRKATAPKPRNAGTMSEAAFWGFIRSTLRQKSRWWKPITQCKMKSRRAYRGPLKRQKFEYQCATCLKWFPDKKVSVDHRIPVGSLNCSADLAGFVERLFCEEQNLQCLCSHCHDIKTKHEKESRKKS